MFSKFIQSPALVRVVPFAIFLALTFLQDRCGEAARYWIYFAKTIVGGAMLLMLFRYISELEWRFTWEAVAVGAAVFVLWIGLDEVIARLDPQFKVAVGDRVRLHVNVRRLHLFDAETERAVL